ncbi:tail fiber protein [Flavobacterium sp. KACC 22758]|mgnify:CR=1 FL=1|jgi:microcystin-dependent protein|uniref:phage tail protein n=1 Tax=Flavobacterium sp. KACC 22758 TaxID=3025667 RepID=UPI00236645E0|nr:tail fiber protein [Flavobacterium sp. KACC 22758]WDF57773.1 tail fiber protein [Flavobacterium sp. KACC 22758]
MEGYLGEIRLFGGNFAPRGWMFCNGATLSIANYEAVYVLLGTIYGGDGQTTFKLPDLQGRIPVGTGQGPGLPNVVIGQIGGTESVTMSTAQMPGHTHVAGVGTLTIPTCSTTGNTASPTNNILAGSDKAYTAEAPDGNLKPEITSITVGVAGASQPFDIIQPSLSTNYIICVEGIFPTRN